MTVAGWKRCEYTWVKKRTNVGYPEKRAIGEEKGINGQRKRQILVPDLSVKRKIEPYFWPFLLFYGHLWAIICELTAILRRIELFYNCFLERNGQIWD